MPDSVAAPRAALEKALFGDPDKRVYAIVDGAQTEGLPARLLEMGVNHHCLFVGELEPEVREVAPQLVSLNEDTGFFEYLVDNGWGAGWAIYLHSTLRMLDLRKHLRTLSLAEMPDGEVVFFRYYDPMTLRSVLPGMSAEQKLSFYGQGAVDCFFCEDDETDEVLSFPADPPAA